MDAQMRELSDVELEDACGGSLGALRVLTQIAVTKMNAATADLVSAADRQRQLNDRMAQMRGLQTQLGNLQVS